MNSMGSYNFIDVLIAGTVLITFILGTWKGLVRTLTALASVVFGVALSARYYSLVQPYLKQVSSLDPSISMILSMIIVFIGVQVVFIGVRRILAKLLHLTKLTWLDRIFGALAGAAAGLLLVAVAVQALLIGVPDWKVVKTSKLVQPVNQLTWKGISYAPKAARDHVQSMISKWKWIQEGAPSAAQRQPARSQKEPLASREIIR
jgi:membrane protein required for colicin V production